MRDCSEQGRTKKDLDNLLKILDVLSVNMVNGQDPVKGLRIVRDESDIRQIKCEKHLVNSPKKEGSGMKDPVCGMDIDEKGESITHKGKEYHFCCASCRWAFEKIQNNSLRKNNEDRNSYNPRLLKL